MARSAAISDNQQAILGKKAWVETNQSTGVFNGLEEIITDKNKQFPVEGKPIVVRRDLAMTKDSLSQKVTMIGKLSGDGRDGDNTLKGYEQEISQYSQTVAIKQKRQAVATTGMEDEHSSPIKLFPQHKPLLADWFKNFKARDYIRKLAGATTFTFANTPTAASTQRILYGGNATATTDIEAADELTPNLVKKCLSHAENEYLAGTDGAYIPPIGKINFGKMSAYLLLVHPDVYDDFLTNSNVQQILRESGAYQKDNPLINAGDIVMYETVIRRCEYLRETNVGQFTTWGSTSDLTGAVNLFMGAAALSCSEGANAKYVPDTDDYDNVNGTALVNMFGCQKAKFNDQDLGIITVKTYRAGL